MQQRLVYSSATAIFVLVLLVALAALPIGTLAARDPALSHEENVRAALREWERGLSGKPINCRRFVDLFIEDGVWSSPAGARNKSAPEPTTDVPRVIKGQRPMYNWCEKQRMFASFDQVESFVSGPVTISGFSAVFPRTILLIMKDISCRMTWQGVSVIDYTEDYLIKRWQDFWNEDEFEQQWKGCQWPFATEESAEKSATPTPTPTPTSPAKKSKEEL